jgi:transcriptional regulator with XRE-family HTH domain
MDLIRYVGERIRELRTNFGGEGISQEALAARLKTTANTVSRWETGTYKPDLEDLEALSRFFGVSILIFFPDQQGAEDEHVKALLRAARQLPRQDVDELRKYAEFRRARAHYPRGNKPRPGRPSSSE